MTEIDWQRGTGAGIAVRSAGAEHDDRRRQRDSHMNSRRFNGSNCIRSPASQGQIIEYRIGNSQSAGTRAFSAMTFAQ